MVSSPAARSTRRVTARLCPAHSTHGDLDGHDESVQIWWTRIVEFFSTEYLGMMGAVNLNVIYFSDSRSPIAAPGSIPCYDDVDDEDDEFFDFEDENVINGDSSPVLVEWAETINDCHIFGFDQVVTISQSTINRLFRYLWIAAQGQKHRDHAIVEWQYEDLFSARFRPATMRLLSNERAIIWLYLEHGDFEVLSDQSPRSDSKYHVDGWHLAFEVALKKVPLPEVGDSEFWITKYKETSVYRAHGGREDRGLECIVLDFADAEFIYQFSNFAGLFQQSRDQTHMASSGNQVRTVINYLQRHYLPRLAQSGLNIIHTVPIRKVETSLMSVESLTTMHFHVYSASTITLENWSHASGSAEPVIVVLGMIQFRPLPAPCLPYSSSLTIRVSKKISYGTIRFTRSAFLDRCILNGLIQINSHTTLIPIFSSIVGPRLTLELNTWAENKWKGTQECEWKESLEHAGLMNYSATCSTCNVVEIPIAARKRSLDIRISGETHLGMSFNSQVRSGSAEAIAKWSAVISIQSEPDGLVVKVIGDLTPTIEAPGPTILGTLPDLRQKLYDHLPKTIDLSQVLDELKAFEGAWHYGYLGLRPYCLANPVINDKGDAIFELRPQGEGSTSVTLSNGGMNSMNGSKGHTFRPGQLSSLCEIYHFRTHALNADVVFLA
ncbi:hypothetical protein EVJ58_g721 [Rhodofomes roseus]|uniref:Uncharacterized protein n=1 Tax=Rhodofomes roseus TaxID=34475 RepID=A0A4Y9Z554_9APHY|nr:hypothetical protein EVJ58_g721 [Rhodofomes roseus]